MMSKEVLSISLKRKNNNILNSKTLAFKLFYLSILAAMSSSRSDDVTQFVHPIVVKKFKTFETFI